MKPGLNARDMIGKTVAAVLEEAEGTHWDDDYLTIVFTDSTYARMKWESGWDGDGQIELTSLEWDDIFSAKAQEQCVALRIVTAEEVAEEIARRQAEKERCARWDEDRERQQYEALRRKFGEA